MEDGHVSKANGADAGGNGSEGMRFEYGGLQGRETVARSYR